MTEQTLGNKNDFKEKEFSKSVFVFRKPVDCNRVANVPFKRLASSQKESVGNKRYMCNVSKNEKPWNVSPCVCKPTFEIVCIL